MSVVLAAADSVNAVLAVGIVEKANQFISDGTELLKGAAGALALYFLIKNLVRSFTFVTLIVSGLLAGLLIWIVGNMNVVKDMTGDEINKPSASATVTVGPASQQALNLRSPVVLARLADPVA